MAQSRTYLVTGASSGIGRALVERLAAAGHRVHATARKEEDLERLGRIANVLPLRLDVRRAESVEAAGLEFERHGGALDGLVHNAGVGDLGPLAAFTDDELRDLFETNVFGPHRVTNAFLDLLLEARGRIVLVGSQGGFLSKPWYGPYTMSKHALEAYAECLRDELAGHGVRVSIVDPGGVKTEIGEKSAPRTRARLERAPEPFAEEALAVLRALDAPAPEFDESRPESEENRRPGPPEAVCEAIEAALFDSESRFRTLVGTRWEGERVLRASLDRLLDANECPSLGYGREQLVALLDERLEGRRAPADRRSVR